MTEWLLPVAVSVAALALTYLFCIRPMRRGRCHGMSHPSTAADGANSEARDLERALEGSRSELAELHRKRSESGAARRQVRAPSSDDAARSLPTAP